MMEPPREIKMTNGEFFGHLARIFPGMKPPLLDHHPPEQSDAPSEIPAVGIPCSCCNRSSKDYLGCDEVEMPGGVAKGVCPVCYLTSHRRQGGL